MTSGAAPEKITDWLKNIVQGLVDQPERVVVVAVPATRTVTLEVNVHPDDFRFVLGRGGCNAESLRTLLAAASKKHRTTYVLSLIDPREIGGPGSPT